jgi:Carboxypeptidase regulatory-like domain
MNRKMNLALSLSPSHRREADPLSSGTVWNDAAISFSRFASALVFCCLFFVCGAASTAAQQPTPKSATDQSASLRGTISTTQDNTASGLPGITVKLTHDPAAGSPLSTTTDENGRYDFKGLPPGSYTIAVEGAGFKSVTKPIVLAPKQQAVQDFSLQLNVVSEKVEVNETAASVTTETAAPPPATVTNTELTTIPTAQEKVKDVLPITPGVIKTLDSKLSFKGADENQSLLLVNSARTTDPVTGSFGVPIPTDAVESFAVYKTPYDASLGSFSGGLTTIETRPPEDQWSFKLRGIVPSFLGKEGHLSGIAEAIPGVSFDVPVIPHKLLFSEVFQYDMKKTTVEGLPWPNDISKRQGFNSFSTLEAILSPTHVLTLTVNAFPLRQQHVDISALVPQPASNDLDQSGVAVGLNDKYQFSSGAIFNLVSQYMRFDSNAHGQGTADMLINPEGWGGNYFNQWSRRGKEFQAVPSFQFPKVHWHGEHEIRVGVDVDYRSFFGTTFSHPINILRQDSTLAQEITFDTTPAQTPSDSSVAEFVQDHWVLDPHWSVDLGARLSSETSGWSAAFAPRAGAAYSPRKSGKTVIRAGAGIFYGVLPLLAADFAANPNRTITSFDPTGVLQIGTPITYTNVYVGDRNPLLSTSLPSGPDTTPRNITWNAEADHELRTNLRLRAAYLDSHTSYLFDVQPFTAALGAPSFMGLTNTGSSHYREFELSAHYTLREHDQVNASYVWSRSRGDLNSLSNIYIPFAAPVIRPDVYGVLASDVPNRFIAWGIFAIPWKMTFSPLVDAHTGFPYSPIDVTQQYVGAPNSERFPTYFSLDLKLYREFRVPFLGNRSGKVHHIRLGVYTLNVTNHHNFNAVYNNTTSPIFGTFAGFLYRHEGMIIDFVD